jgi:hypothetical protein
VEEFMNPKTEGGSMNDRIFWREKGTKPWHSGWISGRSGNKIRIGSYPGDIFSQLWYDTFDIEVEERK